MRTRLVAERLIRPLSNGVRLEQVELAGVPVSVAGAVFEGGTVHVGERQAEVRNLNLSNIVSGDLNASRIVSTALRAAGGIRPDADPSAIYLIRGGHYARLDLSGALAGFAADDVPVTAGDRIVVSSTGCLKDALVRPSQITRLKSASSFPTCLARPPATPCPPLARIRPACLMARASARRW